jgi:SRSO17 transposase
VSAANVALLVQVGRTRWKIENENNNTLKTKGYHFEHNFGHGSHDLANVLATLNILAFLFHTIQELSVDHERATCAWRETTFAKSNKFSTA